MPLNPHKPIPYALSSWSPGTEVFYKCCECGQNFNFYFDHELFCHRCGNKLDWSDSPRHCSKDFKEKYDDLVYNQHAYVRGNREQDQKLVELLRNFYFGDER